MASLVRSVLANQSRSLRGLGVRSAPVLSRTTLRTPRFAGFATASEDAEAEIPQPNDAPVPFGGEREGHTDWSKSYYGLSQQAFPKEAADILLAPVDPLDVECKPDGLLYLPEIKYRRILNRAFGPGAWGLAPRGETNVSAKIVSREYALVCQGRLVAIARGEQEYFDVNGVPTATEACKSNALMRCCKDLGIASELWDPRFIREFKAKYCVEVFAEHIPTKKKKKLWRRKDAPKLAYPYQE
ncbi:mitochondrial genome maintenance MGM101-domain-containing protein [Desarmillaria tabescens]|uniref:Mitochondrial genome maintenance protein MGM101 n=1 Tax=Armillaria tabescens TaxID=1929756 RepID=A0AA39N9S5_ARMTA|nr:mitochondrial genome maintenance MGM101-domain-containing protein [Desarmillaria tabescens]KAK0461662.1 mitochondrial genome maintenance MGM101-domain-containing protein [Desarmillaria tabescens]